MKFYGNGTVWDAEKDRSLCRFNKGTLDTDDKYISDRLMDLGYKFDSVIVATLEEDEVLSVDDDGAEPVEKIDFTAMGVRDLKAYCKDQEYKGYTNLGKVDLLDFIKKAGV